MTTSLAQQLAKLAVPQTTLLKRDKKRASILFDHKEAATLTRQEVYLIGREGLDELIALNGDFKQFITNLFSDKSKDLERAVESTNLNDELNKNIRRFLYILSPHFLNRCAHKALEWLVHRFHVHQYNIDDLVLLILPYHETNIFVRVLQLIKLKDNDKWLWLKPLQRPGVHLPKSTLYTHAASNSDFLKSTCEFVLQVVKANKTGNLSTLFTFYSSTLIGSLEYSNTINESQVTQMLPIILRSFKMDNTDFCAATYMILARLIAKTALAPRFLDSMVDNTLHSKAPSLRIETVLLLVIIYQYQPAYEDITIKSFVKLSQQQWFPNVVQELIMTGSQIRPLLKVLLKKALSVATTEHSDAAKGLVDNLLKLQIGSLVPELIRMILLTYDAESCPDDIQQWFVELFSKIEVQYPDAFDKTINELMKQNAGPTNKLQENFRLLMRANQGVLDWYNTFEKLNHPLAAVRSESVNILINQYNDFGEQQKLFFKSMFIDHLNDNNLDVIYQCLVAGKAMFGQIIDKDTSLDILNDKLLQCQENKQKYWKLSVPALDILCSIAENDDVASFIVVLKFLLPNEADEMDAAKFILNSPYRNNCAFLKNIAFKAEITEKELNKTILSALKRSENLPTVDQLMTFISNTFKFNKYPSYKYISALLVTRALPKNIDFPIANLALETIDACDISENRHANTWKMPNYFANSNNKTVYPLYRYLQCIQTIIGKTNSTEPNIFLNDFSATSDIGGFVIKILDILTKGVFYKEKYVMDYANTLNKFLDKFMTNLASKVLLCLNVAIAETNEITPDLKLRCMLIVKTIIQERSDFTWESYQEIIILCLFSAIKSNHPQIAHIAWDVITTLVDKMNQDDKFTNFLAEILVGKDVILMDNNQIEQIVANMSATKPHYQLIFNILMDLALKNDVPSYLTATYLQVTILQANIQSFTKTSTMALNILQNAITKLSKLDSDIVYSNVCRLTSKIASDIKLRTPVWTFIEAVLMNDSNIILQSGELKSPSTIAMSLIDRELYCRLTADVQIELLDIIIKTTAKSENPDILSAAARIFKHIDLDANSILPILITMKDLKSEKLTESMRKRRVSVIPTVDLLNTEQWKKGVCVLELIQEKKKFTNTAELIPVLFHLLKKCLDFDEQSNVEYPKQLILSSILHCCNKNTVNGKPQFPENVFNMSLIVQCMRSSWNPQTHHHTLLLLSHSATFSPNQVLQNIMAIFTFMGSSYLRHDDAYSFQIIAKIIDTIIPILIQDDATENILSILGVFVDAIIDVPEHRRLILYHQFLEKLNSELYINYFILLIFRSHIKHAKVEKLQAAKTKSASAVPKRLDIAANLLREFNAKTILISFDHMLKYLRELPIEKDDNRKDLIFTMKNYTAKEFRHYKYTLILFTANLLSSTDFVEKIANLSADEMMTLEPIYKNLIIHALTYIQSTSRMSDKSINTPQAQYWKVILHHSFDILDSINALLTPQMFLLVIRGLMTHSIATVRRRALELLNAKLQHNAEFFYDCDDDEINGIIVPLVTIVKTVATENIPPDQEVIVQTALLALKLIAKLKAQKQPEEFVQLLSLVTELVKLKNINANTLASLILCLAELCNQLKMHCISNLNNFMPILIKLLKNQRHEETPSLLLLSVVTAIQKLIDGISLFLSPFLEKILCELTYLMAKWTESDSNPKLAPILGKVKFIWERISLSIQPRVLIPAIENSYNSLIEKKKFKNIGALMIILSKNIDNYKVVILQSHILDLTSFFLNALQFRSLNKDVEASALIESHVIQAFVVLILKLSERSFRPLFYKLYDWALRCDDKSERAITFYSITNAISGNLKGLFVLFAGHFLNNASIILDECNTLKSESLYYDDLNSNIVLLENVLATLNGVFAHDTQKFVNKERFDVLMQPLVDQLENQLGGIDFLEKRAKKILIPTVVNFSVATGDDALWKQLNYQICLKMRHVEPIIRVVALDCLTEMVKKIGEDFLPLLPETIPFLAELLEDEVESVEKACRKSVQLMEATLGEPLQKYF